MIDGAMGGGRGRAMPGLSAVALVGERARAMPGLSAMALVGERARAIPGRSAVALAVALTAACGGGSRGGTGDDPNATDQAPAGEPTRAAPVADLHLHIRTPAAAELVEVAGPTTAADVLAALDSAGVHRGMVLSLAYLFGSPDAGVADELEMVRAENDYVAAQVAPHAERLRAACGVNPLKEYALDEIRRCVDDLGIGTVKLHFTNSDVDLRSEGDRARLRELFALLSESGGAAVVHMRTFADDYGAADARLFIDEVLTAAPDVPVHIAHMAGWGGYDGGTDAALGAFVAAIRDGRLADHPIWFGLGAVVFQPEAAGADTALVRTTREANQSLADRVRQLGLERVVYGTDWPSWPPVPDRVAGIAANVRLVGQASGLTADELSAVYGNEGLLGLPVR